MAVKLEIWGGVCEYGRACYYIDAPSTSCIIDCGINKKTKKLPKIDYDKLEAVEYIFLSHSHDDHSKGIIDLIEKGYDIKVVMTRATGEQLYQLYGDVLNNTHHHFVYIDLLTPPNEPYALTESLTVTFGYNGHMVGSIWVHISIDDKQIFYSGDFSGQTEILKFTSPSDVLKNGVDIAILDSGNSTNSDTWEDCINKIVKQIDKMLEKQESVIIPSNPFSKVIELIITLRQKYQHCYFYYEQPIYNELMKFIECKPVYEELFIDQSKNRVYAETNKAEALTPAIYFVMPMSIAADAMDNKDNILLLAKRLQLQYGKRDIYSMKSHQNLYEIEALLNTYRVEIAILCHSNGKETKKMLSYLQDKGYQQIIPAKKYDTITI